MKSIWNELKYFSRNENWGDPDKINPKLLILLDNFREYLGVPIHINCGYSTSGHTSKSQHYLGNAVDVNFKHKISLLDAYLAAERFNFTGIGVYPHWHTPGLHLDVRSLQENEAAARWMAISTGGNQRYISLDKINIFRYMGDV